MVEEGDIVNRLTDEIKDRQTKKWALRCVMVTSLILMGCMVLAIFWLVRPYDSVRFGDPISTVLTKTVPQGGTIVMVNPSFCVDDVDVSVERWADYFDYDGKRLASFQMYNLELYGKGDGLVCNSPSTSTLTLPNYVIGLNGDRGIFKIRQVFTYRPNPVRVVTIDIVTTAFEVVPASKSVKDGKDG